MPTYEFTSPNSGKTYEFESELPASKALFDDFLSKVEPQPWYKQAWEWGNTGLIAPTDLYNPTPEERKASPIATGLGSVAADFASMATSPVGLAALALTGGEAALAKQAANILPKLAATSRWTPEFVTTAQEALKAQQLARKVQNINRVPMAYFGVEGLRSVPEVYEAAKQAYEEGKTSEAIQYGVETPLMALMGLGGLGGAARPRFKAGMEIDGKFTPLMDIPSKDGIPAKYNRTQWRDLETAKILAETQKEQADLLEKQKGLANKQLPSPAISLPGDTEIPNNLIRNQALTPASPTLNQNPIIPSQTLWSNPNPLAAASGANAIGSATPISVKHGVELTELSPIEQMTATVSSLKASVDKLAELQNKPTVTPEQEAFKAKSVWSKNADGNSIYVTPAGVWNVVWDGKKNHFIISNPEGKIKSRIKNIDKAFAKTEALASQYGLDNSSKVSQPAVAPQEPLPTVENVNVSTEPLISSETVKGSKVSSTPATSPVSENSGINEPAKPTQAQSTITELTKGASERVTKDTPIDTEVITPKGRGKLVKVSFDGDAVVNTGSGWEVFSMEELRIDESKNVPTTPTPTIPPTTIPEPTPIAPNPTSGFSLVRERFIAQVNGKKTITELEKLTKGASKILLGDKQVIDAITAKRLALEREQISATGISQPVAPSGEGAVGVAAKPTATPAAFFEQMRAKVNKPNITKEELLALHQELNQAKLEGKLSQAGYGELIKIVGDKTERLSDVASMMDAAARAKPTPEATDHVLPTEFAGIPTKAQLTKEQANTLAMSAKTNSASREKLLTHLEGLAYHLAKKLTNNPEHIKDLANAALVGFNKAIDKYDITKGNFLSFGQSQAKWEALGVSGSMQGKGEAMMNRFGKLNKAEEKFVGEFGRLPTEADSAYLAKEVGVSEATARKLMKDKELAEKEWASPKAEEDITTDEIGKPHDNTTSREVENKDLAGRVVNALDSLTPIEREVFELKHGLGKFKLEGTKGAKKGGAGEVTYAQIKAHLDAQGKKYGISGLQAIYERAREKVKKSYGDAEQYTKASDAGGMESQLTPALLNKLGHASTLEVGNKTLEGISLHPEKLIQAYSSGELYAPALVRPLLIWMLESLRDGKSPIKSIFASTRDVLDIDKAGGMFVKFNDGQAAIEIPTFYGKSLRQQQHFSIALLHELWHNGITSKISNASATLKASVQHWFEAVKVAAKDAGREDFYGLKNVDEALAEAASNEEFQRFLANTKYNTPDAMGLSKYSNTLFGRFVSLIKDVFGMPKKIWDAITGKEVDSYTSLDEAMRLSARLQKLERGKDWTVAAEGQYAPAAERSPFEPKIKEGLHPNPSTLEEVAYNFREASRDYKSPAIPIWPRVKQNMKDIADWYNRGMSGLKEGSHRESAQIVSAIAGKTNMYAEAIRNYIHRIIGQDALDRRAVTLLIQHRSLAEIKAAKAQLAAANKLGVNIKGFTVGQIYDRAIEARDRLVKAAIEGSTYYNDAFHVARAAGVKVQYHENYVNNPVSEAVHDGGGYFQRGKKYKTITEAILNDAPPQDLDLGYLLERNLKQVLTQVNRKGMIAHMMSELDPIDKQPIFKPFSKELADELGNAYDAVSIFGDTILVHKGHSRLFKALTGKSVFDTNKGLETAYRTMQDMKHFTLIGDLFHMSREAGYSFFIRGKATYEKGLTLSQYTPEQLEALHQAGSIPSEMYKYSKEPIWDGGPTRHEAYKKLVEHGLLVRKAGDKIYSDTISQFPGIGQYNTFLFENFIPGLMVETAIDQLKVNREKWGGYRDASATLKSPEEQLFYRTANEVNTRFGNMEQQGVFKNATMRKAMQMVFLAPWWVEGLVWNDIRAIRDFGAAGKDALTEQGKERIRIGMAGKALASSIGTMFVANQIINQFTRGKFTWENDEKDPLRRLDAWIPGGDHGFYVDPFAPVGELIAQFGKGVLKEDRDFVDVLTSITRNKLAPATRGLTTFISGRDFWGQPVDGLWDRFKTAALEGAPLPLFIKPTFEKKSGAMMRQAIAFSGVKVEPVRPMEAAETRYNEVAKERFGKPMDELPLFKQLAARREAEKRYPDIAEKPLSTIAKREKFAREEGFMQERVLAAFKNSAITSALEEQKLNLSGVSPILQVAGQRVWLSEEDKYKYAKLVAQESEKMVGRLVLAPQFEARKQAVKQQIINNVVNMAKKRAKAKLIADLNHRGGGTPVNAMPQVQELEDAE